MWVVFRKCRITEVCCFLYSGEEAGGFFSKGKAVTFQFQLAGVLGTPFSGKCFYFKLLFHVLKISCPFPMRSKRRFLVRRTIHVESMRIRPKTEALDAPKQWTSKWSAVPRKPVHCISRREEMNRWASRTVKRCTRTFVRVYHGLNR